MVRVVHLTGSAVSPFLCDLSRLYARDCLEAVADPARLEPHLAYVTPDGRWRFPADLTDAGIAAAEPLAVGAAVQRLVALELDAMVPQMFCVPGMTTYRALFELLGVPGLGNPADVMALTADKARAKAVVAAAGVAVPAGELLGPGDRPTVVAPAVVKPVATDNSVGVSRVGDASEYDAALTAAFEHGDRALVETYVPLGREVRCGIVVRAGELVCLPLEEYAVDGVRTPQDKLARDEAGELQLMAKTAAKAWIVDRDDPLTEVVWDAARCCHVALGCRHYSLFDFRVDPDGQPWFLEAGLYCSFSPKSVIAVMAQAAGIATDELFGMTLDNAIGGRS